METDVVAAKRYNIAMMNQWVKQALAHAGLSQAEATRRLVTRFNWPDDRSVLNKMIQSRRGIEISEALQIAELTGYPLPREEDQKSDGFRRIEVAAPVQAGAWSESWEWDDGDRYAVMIPDYPEYRQFRLFAAEARGTSMNRRYQEGTVLVFVDVNETGESPIPGKRYIVERKKASGEAEHTVKLLHADADGQLWLMPESDDPRFQGAISFEEGTEGGDVVAIIGRVIAAVTRE